MYSQHDVIQYSCSRECASEYQLKRKKAGQISDAVNSIRGSALLITGDDGLGDKVLQRGPKRARFNPWKVKRRSSRKFEQFLFS